MAATRAFYRTTTHQLLNPVPDAIGFIHKRIPLQSSSFSPHLAFRWQWGKRSYSSSGSKISMSLKAGIVGLPNVGKSTLFNAVVSILFSLFPSFSISFLLVCFLHCRSGREWESTGSEFSFLYDRTQCRDSCSSGSSIECSFQTM